MIFTKDEKSKYDFISWGEFILIILLMLGVTIFLPLIIMLIYPPFEAYINSSLFVFYLLFSMLLNLYIIYFFCCKKRNKGFKEGLFFVEKSVKTYRACAAVGFLMPLLTAPLMIKFAPKEAADMIIDRGSLIIIFATAAIIPVFEEIFYRGFIFSFLQSKLNSFWAILLTTFAFSLAHVFNINAAPVLFVLFVFYSFVITFVRYSTGSVIASTVTHIVHNFTLMGGFLLFKAIGL